MAQWRRFPLPFPFTPWIPSLQASETLADDFVDASEDVVSASPGAPHVVYRTHFITLAYMSGQPQPLEIHHCVRFLQIDAHLGEFQLLESSGRVLGTSIRGRLSLTELDTDIAHVLFQCMSRNSVEYQMLHDVYHVSQPGMDLEYIQPLRILFLNAPAAAPDQRIIHIPLWCRIATPWDPQEHVYMKKKSHHVDAIGHPPATPTGLSGSL